MSRCGMLGARLRLASICVLAALLASCATPPAGSPAAASGAAGISGAGPQTSVVLLQPLVRHDGTPVDAPRSQVASVRYDLAVGIDGDLPSSDGATAGSNPPGDVFQRGGASYYGLQFHQRKTASGELFNMGAMTAAHKTLAFGTRVCVRSMVNGREVLVRINDRGPYAAGRIIDLSQAAAEAIGMIGLGIKQVALSLVGPGGRCNGAAVAGAGDDVAAAHASTPHSPVRQRRAAKPRRQR